MSKKISELFDECENAFRLEVLPHYIVENEAEPLKFYLEGVPLPPKNTNQDWLNRLKKASLKGQVFKRLRIMPENLTSYIKFEIEWEYVNNVASGEKIKILPKNMIEQKVENNLKDYWLFDDKTAFELRYDDYGKFLSVDLIKEDKVIKSCIDTKNQLWPLGIELTDYLKDYRLKIY